MSIEELLVQMEQYRLRREQRDYRPEWLKSFIGHAASVFEPLTHVGRVGYDCQLDERCWTVSMYLGTTEIVGGPKDGRIDPASFRIDLAQLSSLFKTVSRFEWYSIAESITKEDCSTVRSLISIHGSTPEAEEIRLELFAVPPQHVRPGLHCRPDGMIYETH